MTSAVMVRWVHVRPSSVEAETLAWMTSRAVGSTPGREPPKPWSYDFTWKLKIVPVSRSTT